MSLSKELDTFYNFITAHDAQTSSYVMTATATICDPKFLATDQNGRCHAFVKKPEYDARNKVWIEQDKGTRFKVFVFKLPTQVAFDAAQSLQKLRRGK